MAKSGRYVDKNDLTMRRQRKQASKQTRKKEKQREKERKENERRDLPSARFTSQVTTLARLK